MREEDLDHGPGAVGVVETAAGLSSEPLMGRGEGPRRLGPHQWRREEHGFGLAGEDLKVVVQHQHLVALAALGVAR